MTLETQHVTQQTIRGCLLMRVHDQLSCVLVAFQPYRLLQMTRHLVHNIRPTWLCFICLLMLPLT